MTQRVPIYILSVFLSLQYMRREFTWFLSVVVGSFLIFAKVFSANSDIIINEVGAAPTSTHEWIELWNKGSEPVDLSGWIFWEATTSHRLAATSSDAVLAPGEYAAIVQNAKQFKIDHPDFVESIFDSSWGSLSEDGEEIGLKDAAGNFIERFTYTSTKTTSLERRNPFLEDYSSANWVSHPSSNSLGKVNAAFFVDSTSTISTSTLAPTSTTITSSSESQEVATTTINTPTTTELVSTTAENFSTSTLWERVVLNEIVSDPESGAEWIEIFNTNTSSLDLVGGTLCDGRAGDCTIAPLVGRLLPQDWLVVFLSSSHLNNDGDSVFLKDPSGRVVDRVIYGSTLAAPKKSQALARRNDGRKTGDDQADWALTTELTPGAANKITLPAVVGSSSSRNTAASGALVQAASNPSTSTYVYNSASATIYVSEIFPNPAGADEEKEFIELKNRGAWNVNLFGWKLKVDNKQFALGGEIAPGEWRAFFRTTTGLVLRNTGGSRVELIGPNNTLVDGVVYSTATEGSSYARTTSSEWMWTRRVTPGKENQINSPLEAGVVWRAVVPEVAEVYEKILFDADDSTDARGGELSFRWDFGDGTTATSSVVEHSFSTTGTFVVALTASSSAGTFDEKNFVVRIGLAPPISTVLFTEVFPYPASKDDKEFIELTNVGTSTVVIGGWRIQSKSGKEFVFPKNTFLLPAGVATFYSTATHLTLNNQGDGLELRNADGGLIDGVFLPQAVAGKSYALMGGVWEWLNTPTPGKINGETEAGAQKELFNFLGEEKSTGRVRGGSQTVAPVTLGEVRALPKGTKVFFHGRVVAKPGVFGVQYAYVGDETGGIAVYMHNKDFPALVVGQEVTVFGEISSAAGVVRVNVKNKNDIHVRAPTSTLTSIVATVAEMNADRLGALFKTKGEITKVKRNGFYLDDGEEEIFVVLKTGTALEKTEFKEGSEVEVTGVLEQGKAGLQLWPRGEDDIHIIGLAAAFEQKKLLQKNEKDRAVADRYLTATAGGITTLLFGLLARARGVFFLGVIKKGGQVALNILRKTRS